jgi:citrate synthase
MSPYLDAQAAAARLGVTRATLYAYVSRGVIRSRVEPGRRSRQYYAEDVERWLKQQSGRRDPGKVAENALFVDGLPVLSSQLSLIDSGRLYYRGRDAIALCHESSFEDVVGLLWGGAYQPQPDLHLPSATEQKRLARLHFAAACQCQLAEAESRDLGAYNLTPDAVRRTGARILGGLSALGTGAVEAPRALAPALARAWRVRGRQGVHARGGVDPVRRSRAQRLGLHRSGGRLRWGHAVHGSERRARGALGLPSRRAPRARRGVAR